MPSGVVGFVTLRWVLAMIMTGSVDADCGARVVACATFRPVCSRTPPGHKTPNRVTAVGLRRPSDLDAGRRQRRARRR